MTKEELKQHCEKQVECCETWARNNGGKPHGKIYEEHKLILDLIKALEQQPSEDCVNRASVKELFQEGCVMGMYDFLGIDDLPPVTPTRKSGLHWIERFNNEDKWLECPYCHKDSDNAYNYCPNCGISFKAEKRGNENEVN